MKIKTTIEINDDLIKTAQKHHLKTHSNIMISKKDLMVGIFALMFGLLIAYQMIVKTGFKLIPVLFITIIFIIGLYLIIKCQRSSLGSYTKKYPWLKEKVDIEISEMEISATINNASSKIKWDFFTEAVILDEMVMLYDISHEYRILPRSCFRDGDYGLLVSMVKEKIKRVILKKFYQD